MPRLLVPELAEAEQLLSVFLRLSEIKKESFNNQKADYRSWADKSVPDDFKLLMRAAIK